MKSKFAITVKVFSITLLFIIFLFICFSNQFELIVSIPMSIIMGISIIILSVDAVNDLAKYKMKKDIKNEWKRTDNKKINLTPEEQEIYNRVLDEIFADIDNDIKKEE